jgi:hypothetical protein
VKESFVSFLPARRPRRTSVLKGFAFQNSARPAQDKGMKGFAFQKVAPALLHLRLPCGIMQIRRSILSAGQYPETRGYAVSFED